MTKPRVLVSCFPYFINNFIAYDFFIFKEKNKMNKMIVILVMLFLFEKKKKLFCENRFNF
jgi:hypothetical protein